MEPKSDVEPPEEIDYQKMVFPQALRALRIEEGITQGELAFLVGVTPCTIRKWENGEMNPVKENCDKLELLFPQIPLPAAPQDKPKPVGAAGMTHTEMNRTLRNPRPLEVREVKVMGESFPKLVVEPKKPKQDNGVAMMPTAEAQHPTNGIPPTVKWANMLAEVAGSEERHLFARALDVVQNHSLSYEEMMRLYEVFVSNHFDAFSELVRLSPSVGVKFDILTTMIKGAEAK